MPGSPGAINVGPAGRTLKGWVVLNTATGAIVAQSGAFSAPIRSGAGNYSLTIAGGLVASISDAVWVVRISGVAASQAACAGFGACNTVTSAQILTYINATLSDFGSVHAELWA